MPPRQSKLSFPKEGKAFVKPSSTSSKGSQPNFSIPMPPPPLPLSRNDVKGKGKAVPQEREVEGASVAISEGIWADLYPPETEQELAVHKKKVEVVRRWLVDAFESISLRKYRKLLILAGPAGAGKTATIRVLSQEMKVDILEWKNTADEVFTDEEYDFLSRKFQTFMSRASGLTSLATSSSDEDKPSKRQLILLEDLPNLLHGPTLQMFQTALGTHIVESDIPVVLILSNAGSRGQHKDEEGWLGRQSSVMDFRTVVPISLQQSPYVTKVEFNPVAKTLMKKGLQYTVDRRFRDNPKGKPSRDTIDAATECSEGDIRGALMTLQFASPLEIKPLQKSRKGGSTTLQLITRREHSLALFHLLGKVLYNKRVEDPFGDSLSKKDREAERALDKLVPKPAPLPAHLTQWTRRGSRVDPNAIYGDSPVDTSLYSLYLHQNYTQFCRDAEECDGIIDTLSLVDAMGDTWDSRGQVAMEKFHTLTLGTLVHLPSPVPRQGQKMFKSDFFDYLKSAQRASDAAADAFTWLLANGGSWSPDNVKLWLPALLKSGMVTDIAQAVPDHYLFSSLAWDRSLETKPSILEDSEDDATDVQLLVPEEKQSSAAGIKPHDRAADKFWIEEDDIGEF